MVKFTTETEGLDTFRVCEITEGIKLDTVGLGMLLNNKVHGLAPISHVKMDNKEFVRYNISSQISLKQLFMEKADKKRFLTVLKNILTTAESLDDYMLDPAMLLLNKEEIYINVGTLHTDLLYYPIMENVVPFKVADFVRNLIMSMEFDSNEDSSYVTLLINFLNRPVDITVTELKKYVVELLQGTQKAEAPTANHNYMGQAPMNQAPYGQVSMNQAPYGQPAMNHQAPMGQPMMNQTPMGQPSMNQAPMGQSSMNQTPMGQSSMNQAPMGQSSMNQAPYGQPMMNQAPMGQPMMNQAAPAGGFAVPGMDATPTAPEASKKKKGFSLFSKEPKQKKEKAKKEKPAKPEKKAKKGKAIEAPAGIVIPGMENTKNSTLPDPPKPMGAPSMAPMNNFGMPPMEAPANNYGMPPTEAPANNYGMPSMEAPANNYGMPAMEKPANNMNMSMPGSAATSMGTPNMNIPPMSAPVNNYSAPSMDIPPIVSADGGYGQTVVLSADTSGETTVLSAGYNTVQKKNNPYLIRKRTNEKIEITKDFFKIGKERSYVDYWISDNSAISRSHADIMKQNQEFFIIDNNSLNHTFIGGQQIPSQQMTKLEDFAVVTLADEVFEFRL